MGRWIGTASCPAFRTAQLLPRDWAMLDGLLEWPGEAEENPPVPEVLAIPLVPLPRLLPSLLPGVAVRAIADAEADADGSVLVPA